MGILQPELLGSTVGCVLGMASDFDSSLCGLQVYMDRVRVELVSSIVGTAASDVLHLVNNEETPFSFAFDRKMLAQAGGDPHRPVLQINPVAGTTHHLYPK